jgi:hypothetical protein
VDKETLFGPRLDEEDVPLAGLGTVRVRGLNRLEALRVSEATGAGERDRLMLAAGMIDPKMTLADVRKWQEASPGGEIEQVSEVIARLSKMLPQSGKDAYKSPAS